ncbi:MAG TPA: 50S ribosomal protein L11 methyltransferase [Ignavibacteriaceae bacterium]|nr:50S ribosomal protein L11 methyltransferase [Ignavibacteriaceae bacterium]
MKNFFAYKIFTKPFDPELLSGIMWDYEITGLLENDDHITVFTSDNSSANENQFNSSLMKLKNEKLIESFRIEKEILEDKNWNELWEKSREVIRVSDRIIIKPTFKEYHAKQNEIVLTIDPKMSFGTGEHQTTKLILRLLEKYIKPGMRVLDVGSGTGILAIASVKLGASKAVAADFDEICLENCNENCELNEVSDLVEIITGEIDDVKENNFDLVLANIQKNVLLDIADKIKSKLKTGGVVILSGLLEIDKEAIEEKYQSLGFRTEQIEKMDEWIAVVLMER